MNKTQQQSFQSQGSTQAGVIRRIVDQGEQFEQIQDVQIREIPMREISIRPIETEAIATIDALEINDSIVQAAGRAGVDFEVDVSHQKLPDGSELMKYRIQVSKEPG